MAARTTILFFVLLWAFMRCVAVTAQPQQPNVLFIFADDLAFDSVGFMGNDRVETPNLDRLAKRGTVFTHAFNSGAWGGAVCVASRTMLMTGKQLWNARSTDLDQAVRDRQLWPQRMADAGYSTWFAGKWHVGDEKRVGQAWQHSRHVRPGMPNQTPARYERTFAPGQNDWSPTDTTLGGYWNGGRHWSEVLTDDCAVFFDELEKSGSNQPFFMMLAFNAPHDPRQAPAEFQQRYPCESIPLPGNFLPEYPHDFEANRIRDELLAPFPRTEYAIRVCRSEYYALITHMDAQVGHMLEALEKSGRANNTIVIFTADHGLACGQHGMMGKQNQYEHSVRVPWVIAGPGIPAGQRISDLVHLQDAMATALEIAGASRNESDGFDSLMPRIRGESGPARTTIFGSYTLSQRMARDEKFKLIRYPKTGLELLFDLESDPLEMHDVAADPRYASDVTRLASLLEQKMRESGDPLAKE